MDLQTIRDLVDAAVTDRRRFLALLAGAGLTAAPLTRGRAQDGDMTYFTWAGYELPEFHQAYIDKYGAAPNITFYGDTDEALAKMRSGFGPDVIHPLVQDVGRWAAAEVIRPIDTSRLSNWPKLAPALVNDPGTQVDGQQYFAPNDWGITSVVYREDLVAPADIEANSWSLLMNEAYAGRLAMYDSNNTMIQFAGIMAGVADTTAPTEDELAAMKDVWVRQRDLLRQYFVVETDAEAMLASGEIVACPLWPASVNRLIEQGVPVRIMSSPKEGAFVWMAGLVIGIQSDAHLDRAYDFIDAWLSPEAGKYLIEAYGYGHSNLESFALASPEAIRTVGLDPDRDIAGQMANLQPFPTLSNEALETYVGIMDEVKAGGG